MLLPIASYSNNMTYDFMSCIVYVTLYSLMAIVLWLHSRMRS